MEKTTPKIKNKSFLRTTVTVLGIATLASGLAFAEDIKTPVPIMTKIPGSVATRTNDKNGSGITKPVKDNESIVHCTYSNQPIACSLSSTFTSADWDCVSISSRDPAVCGAVFGLQWCHTGTVANIVIQTPSCQ